MDAARDTSEGRGPMKFFVAVKATEASEAGEMPSEELLREMSLYNEKLVKAGIMQAGEGLHPSSKGARVHFTSRAGRRIVDGPFAETKELVAGYWIFNCKSLDEAIDWVRQCPNPTGDVGVIEIRQIFEAEDFGTAYAPDIRERDARMAAEISMKKA
jgi:hypothetical protein